MTIMPGFETVPAPRHPAGDFFAHEKECRTALAPAMERLLERAVAAGWNRRTAASALMFLAAAQVTAASGGAKPQ